MSISSQSLWEVLSQYPSNGNNGYCNQQHFTEHFLYIKRDFINSHFLAIQYKILIHNSKCVIWMNGSSKTHLSRIQEKKSECRVAKNIEFMNPQIKCTRRKKNFKTDWSSICSLYDSKNEEGLNNSVGIIDHLITIGIVKMLPGENDNALSEFLLSLLTCFEPFR